MALRKADLIALFEQGTIGCSQQFTKSILKATGRGDVYAARDYIKANCLLAELRKEGIDVRDLTTEAEALLKLHPAVRYRLGIQTPCLAFRYDELKPPQQEGVFNDKNFVFLEKENGVRGTLIIYKGETFLFSRNYSDKDCALCEYWGNVYQEPLIDQDEILVMDVEVKFEVGDVLREELLTYGIQTESKLEAMSALLQMNQFEALQIQSKFKEGTGKDLITFRMIAPLYFKGVNYLKKTLGEGMDVYDEVIAYARECKLNVKPIKRCEGSKEEKEIFLDTIIQEGGEGIVAHYRKGSYNTTDKRSKTSYIKLKRSVKSTMLKAGIGDTIDGWISGFEMSGKGTANEGLVGSVKVSINLITTSGHIREHVIAQVANLTLETKKEMTVVDSLGVVSLNEMFLNQV